ncbi:MAG: Uma2 family endonuclease [Anaerolineae bacterium]|jgi:Uma2 family endonuclease|nr:Uma2 family endonuclease [Anaerolineae bacterium]
MIQQPLVATAEEVAEKLYMYVLNHMKLSNAGHVTDAKTGYVLSHEPYFIAYPTVGVIAKSRMSEPPAGDIPYHPDFAIEVISSINPADVVQTKTRAYLNVGVRQVWVAHVKSRSIAVYSPDIVFTVPFDGTLFGEDMLPGFKLTMRDLYSKG